jgi:4-hydroxybenzoate polyprenyltransferase
MLCHAVFLTLMVLVGQEAGLGAAYYAGLVISALFMVQQYFAIRGRDRQRCFKSFLDNNRVGAAVFAGLVLDFLLR